MTLEDRIKSCQVCSNRRFNPDSGLICGLSNEKPSFEESCPNYKEDTAAVEEVANKKAEAEKPSEIKGLFAFFLYFSIPVGIIITLISFFLNYGSADYQGSFCLKALDIVYLLFYLYFSIYTIYAFLKRKPDAVFIAKYLLIALFLSNLFVVISGATDSSYLNSTSRIIGSLVWSVIFFVFLCISPDVEDRIPKKIRKIQGFNKHLFILSIVLPLLLIFGGILEIIGQNGAFSNVERKIEIACEQNRADYPSYVGDGLVSTDMRVEGKSLVYEYVHQNTEKEDYTESQLTVIGLLGEENIKLMLPSLTSQDPIFPLLKKAGYDIVWKYNDANGKYLYSIIIPNDVIVSSMKPGFIYETTNESFGKLINAFNKDLPYELMEDCIVRKVSLDDEGETLHYDIMLIDTNSSVLAELTPSYLKEYMADVLPLIQDAPLALAKSNGKDISFDFHADNYQWWSMSAKFTLKDYDSEE